MKNQNTDSEFHSQGIFRPHFSILILTLSHIWWNARFITNTLQLNSTVQFPVTRFFNLHSSSNPDSENSCFAWKSQMKGDDRDERRERIRRKRNWLLHKYKTQVKVQVN